jgi:ubiquinone/menaquinone biosynthesis C-methylase UbiE
MKRKILDAQQTRRRYDRLAIFYDYMEAPMEWLRFASWRARLRDRLVGYHILEVGVGTGKNFSYYLNGAKISAIDISPRMLKRACKRADSLGVDVNLFLPPSSFAPFQIPSLDFRSSAEFANPGESWSS